MFHDDPGRMSEDERLDEVRIDWMRSRRGGPLSGKLTSERHRKRHGHASERRTRSGRPQADDR